MTFQVIPAIDLRSGRCVRWVRGDPRREIRYGDDPVAWAKEWKGQGAGHLHVVDLDGALEGAPRNLEAFKRIVDETGLLAQLGGGLRSAEDVRKAFLAGAWRVLVSTRALQSEDFLRAAIEEHGADRVLVSLDVGVAGLMVSGWKRGIGDAGLERAFSMLARLGVRRVVVTDVERDGTMSGSRFESAAAAARAGFGVLAAGGVASLEDLRSLRALRGIEGAIVGRALYEGRFRLEEALNDARIQREGESEEDAEG